MKTKDEVTWVWAHGECPKCGWPVNIPVVHITDPSEKLLRKLRIKTKIKGR